MLLSVTRHWPWGLAVLSDPQDAAAVPTSFGDAAVVSTAQTVVSRIEHGDDGEATATVRLDAPPGLLRVHSGHLTVTSGRLRLGDAGSEGTQEVALASGRYEVQVLVDDAEHPAEVHFVLTP